MEVDMKLDTQKLNRDVANAIEEMQKKLEIFQQELAEIQSCGLGIQEPIQKTELDLSGNYQVANKVLTRNDGMQLFLGRREKSIGRKPKDFLLLIENGKKTYCSSLFPSLKAEGTYNLDYLNRKYLLTFLDVGTKAIVQRRCSTNKAVNQ